MTHGLDVWFQVWSLRRTGTAFFKAKDKSLPSPCLPQRPGMGPGPGQDEGLQRLTTTSHLCFWLQSHYLGEG